MEKKSLKEAYQQLQDARTEYNEAFAFLGNTKGERKKLLQKKMDAAEIKIRILLNDCPELWDYADNATFGQNYFKSDLDLLISNLSKLNLDKVS